PVAGADEHVAGTGRAVEVVPLPQRTLLLLDDQRALARQHEKSLLRALRVVERVRAARPDDADVDADVGGRVLSRLDRVRRAALLVVAYRERVRQVEDEPALRRDVAAVRGLLGACFLHGHRSSLVGVFLDQPDETGALSPNGTGRGPKRASA